MVGNVNFDNLLTTTLESRTGKLADNVSDNNALLKRLKERGNIRPVSGGTKIVEELEYGESDSIWYTGYDKIDFTNPQLFSAAEFDLKLLAAPVGISGEELLKNAGKERVIDLLEAKIKNAEKTLMNQMSTAIYSDGTGSGGKQLTGLQALVSDAPTTGTVGGIDRASNEFWRNHAKTSAVTAENIYAAMNEVYMACSRGSDRPDIIVADDELYATYEASLVPQQRFTNAKLAEAGFTNLKFKGADVIYDGGVGGKCPAGHMYFLNTEYLRLRPHKERNFKLIGGERMAINQDAIYKIIGWAGNLTMSNAQLQGVLIKG
jgi:outer membrane protein assembly factor BamB